MKQGALWVALLAIATSGCFGGDAEKGGSSRAGSTSEPGDAVAPSAAEDGFVTVPAATREGVATAIDEVFRELRDAGLRVATTSAHLPGSDVGIPFGSAEGLPWVTEQRPDAGTRVKAGSVVRLRVVPGGPFLLPRPPPESSVPDLTGLTLREALPRIRSAGIFWRTVLPPLPPSRAAEFLDAYRVTSQDPPAEGRGSWVHFDVAPAG
jgi:hypothetical protein